MSGKMSGKGGIFNAEKQRRREAEKVRLGEVCSASTSQLRQKDLDNNSGPYPLYGASGLIKKVDFFQLDIHGLGIVKDGAGVGRVMRLPPFSSVIGTVMIIRPQSCVDCDFLYYALANQNLGTLHTGATIPHLYFKDFKDRMINLPPLPEQKRIAATLDRICELKKNAEVRLAKLDLLVKSRFVEMFGDVDGSSFPKSTIGAVCEVKSGGTPDRKVPEYWENGNIPWVKTTELKNGELFDSEEHITNLAMNESSAKLVPPETILLAMYGQGRTRGMTAKLKIAATTNQACACILPSQTINQDFLWHYLVLSYDKIRALAQGAGQPNLNGKMIRSFAIPLPPLALQREFAAFVEKVEKLKESARCSAERLDVLYRSKLQEYFG